MIDITKDLTKDDIIEITKMSTEEIVLKLKSLEWKDIPSHKQISNYLFDELDNMGRRDIIRNVCQYYGRIGSIMETMDSDWDGFSR